MKPPLHDDANWPFVDLPNVAVFTTRFVMDGEPICFAYRNWEDATWQFLPRRATETNDAMLVGLKEIYKIDPSISDLADLPEGWMASRSDRGCPWVRARNHPYPVFADDRFYLDDATAYERLYPETYRIPPKEVRENLRVGDTVKLIFRFADERASRQDNDSERMWVSITEVDIENYRYRGTLAKDPLLHGEIAYNHDLWFHPSHVFDIAKEAVRLD